MSTGEPVDEQESSSSQSSSAEQVDELRADLTAKVVALLEVDDEKARKIVEAFDTHVARPVEKKFAELQPHDLTKRNPYFYAVLGITSVEDWVDRVTVRSPTVRRPGVALANRRFATRLPPRPCGANTRNWLPAQRFRGQGRYTVTLRARDTSGLTSAPARRTFRR